MARWLCYGVEWHEWLIGAELDWTGILALYLGPLYIESVPTLGGDEYGVRRWAVKRRLGSIGRLRVTGCIFPLAWVFGLSVTMHRAVVSLGPMHVIASHGGR